MERLVQILQTMIMSLSLFFTALLGLMFFAVISLFFVGGKGFKEMMNEDQTDASIGLIKIEGVIDKSETLLKKIAKVEKDNKIKAVILRIDTPGGAVAPTQEVYEEIRRLDQIKPVYASFGTVAASGGYYIGAAARQIFASKGTITGSIGVITTFLDLSKVLEKYQVKVENHKSGKYKDITSPTRPRTQEERNLIEESLKKTHEQFMFDILATRAQKIKGDLKDYATGMFFTGAEALEKGLVDQIGGVRELARFIQKEHNLKSSEYVEVKVINEAFLEKFLGQIEERIVMRLKNILIQY